MKKCTMCHEAKPKEEFIKHHLRCRACYRAKYYRDHTIAGTRTFLANRKERQCLSCDKKFLSTGNRRCEHCNSTHDCHYESNTTLWVRC